MLEFLATLNASYIPFLLIILIMAGIMYRAHISSKEAFNLYDALSDTITGKASIEKIFMMCGGMTVTWWFIDLVANHKATWEDAVAYGGLLGMAKVANSYINAKYNQPQEEISEAPKEVTKE